MPESNKGKFPSISRTSRKNSPKNYRRMPGEFDFKIEFSCTSYQLVVCQTMFAVVPAASLTVYATQIENGQRHLDFGLPQSWRIQTRKAEKGRSGCGLFHRDVRSLSGR